ncbi:MAG: helix-turn-helix domain-containing protein [Candidatus Melainabacteria bacterium]|nr:MAG: helix-turn-helix domain-containing protein [Candidatus Melainabacteria bacterium]
MSKKNIDAEGSKAKRFLSVAEAAQYLGVSEKLIYRMVWNRELEHARLGTAIRIDEEVLLRKVRELTVAEYKPGAISLEGV